LHPECKKGLPVFGVSSAADPHGYVRTEWKGQTTHHLVDIFTDSPCRVPVRETQNKTVSKPT